MIGEVTAAAASIEVTAKATEATVAREVAKETVKEVGKEAAKKTVDVTKRIDVTMVADTGKSGVDITKRISPEGVSPVKEITKKDVSNFAKDYINDLKDKSDFPETLKDKKLDVNKLEKQPKEKVSELREEFEKNRTKLREEWAKQNNQEWPRYDHDVYSDDGKLLRRAGDRLDAHHIQPLELGGKNTAENITPMDISKHRDIHSANGSCTKLVDGVKEVSKL